MHSQSTFFTTLQDRWPAEENTPGVAQENHTLSRKVLFERLAGRLATHCVLALPWGYYLGFGLTFGVMVSLARLELTV